MKRISFLLIFMLYSFCVWAQRHTIPLNLPNYDRKTCTLWLFSRSQFNDFKITANAIQETHCSLSSPKIKRIQFRYRIHFRLGRNTDLRFLPTLSFAERDIIYTIEVEGELEEIKKDIESTFIEFPIKFKYKSNRYNNGRAYLLTGAKLNIDLASQRNIDDEGQELIKLKTGPNV